jgi:hypothetical protein
MSWRVKLQPPGMEGLSEIELNDVVPFFKAYPEVKRNFFDELVSNVNKNKDSFVGANIKAVIGPDEQDWSSNAWLLLIARETEKEAPFWLLFKREKTLAGYLVALGPKGVASYAKDEGLDEIRRILEYIIAFANRWDISIFLPAIPDAADVPPPKTAAATESQPETPDA